VARRRKGTAQVFRGNTDEIEVIDAQHGWQVRALFTFVDGLPTITELHLDTNWVGLHPEQSESIPRGGVTTTLLRRISTTALFDALGRDNTSAWTLAHHGRHADEDFLSVPRPGRRGRGDAVYALWAQRYLAKCEKTRHPYPELAAEHEGYNERAIRDLVQSARRRGLLKGGSQGRAGGTLTPKAKSLLDRMEGEEE